MASVIAGCSGDKSDKEKIAGIFGAMEIVAQGVGIRFAAPSTV